jgi:cysteine synthase A
MRTHIRPVSGSILEAIGNTPMVQLQRVAAPGSARIFLKLEYYNPTGSYKDRMALSVIEGAERRGALKPGMRVVEYTGGSTGSSLAMVCAIKGYAFTVVSSDAFAREKLDTMRAFGASLIVVPSGGGISPELFDRLKAEVAREAAQPGVFWADQFHNCDVEAGYKPMGKEILQQLKGERVSAFCAAVGTAGMLAGVSAAFRENKSRTQVIALEPAESPVLTTGKPGTHHVEGVGVGFWPAHLRHEDFHDIRAIKESAARAMARRLAREEGILAGTSTGMNVAAAVELAAQLGPDGTVVTVAVDSGLKYLAGGLFNGA